MKLIHYILICCLLGLVGCSKDDWQPLGEGLCASCGPPRIISVKYLPNSNQSITLQNNNDGTMAFDSMYLEHTADTIKYFIPVGTTVAQWDSLIITGAQLGFAIDTITDTVYLKAPTGYLYDIWSH